MSSGSSGASQAGSAVEVPRLGVHLLGGFRVEWAGEPLPEAAWRRRSAKSLIKLLALAPGHSLHRELIAESLWPDLHPEAAEDHLHKAISAARHALEPGLTARGSSSYLRLADDLVSLRTEHLWVDVDHFRALAEAAQGSNEVERYESALAAYAGDLLPEDRYEDWVQGPRDELTERSLALLIGLADALEREGQQAAAIQRLRQVIEREPGREDVHRRLMRLYMAVGSRHQAMRQYQACVQALSEELDAAPDDETVALYQTIVTNPAAFTSAGLTRTPAALQRLWTGPHVGRERARQVLAQLLERAATGKGATVFVSGEAGIGKSRLVAELAREAQQRRSVTLYGAAYAEEGVLPYGPFIRALDEHLADGPEELKATVVGQYPEVARLVPRLSVDQRSHRALERPDASRLQLFTAMVRLLSELSRFQPLVLLLEDLHAADEASVQLLAHLARAGEQRPWVIVSTYREEDVLPSSTLWRVATTATREGIAHHVGLLRLSPEESTRLVEALLGSPLDPALLGRLYGLSLGNPLFLVELVHTVQEVGPEALDEARHLVPQSVHALVETRATRLTEPGLRTAELAAVAGMESPFALLWQASRCDESALLDALDALLEARILEERGEGYSFGHPLFREALYARLSAARRRHLHRSLAGALEALSPDAVEALAHHYRLSGEQEKTIDYLERAGDRARSQYANDVAESYYRQALDLLRAAERPRDVARVEGKLGSSLIALARYGEALELLERAAEGHAAAADRESLALTIAEIGHLHWERGTAEEGIRRVQALLPELEAGGMSPAAACRLYVALAHLAFGCGRYEEELKVAERASALARAAGDDWLLAEAEMRRGTGYVMLNAHDAGRPVLEAAIPIAEAAGNLDALARCASNLGASFEVTGEMGRAREYRERCLHLAQRMGNPAYLASAQAFLGGLYFWIGRWEEARDLYERSLAALQAIGTSWYAPFTMAGLAAIALHQDRLEEARGYAVEALETAERMDNWHATNVAQRVLAEVEVRDGNADAAYERLSRYLARSDLAEGAKAWVSPPLIEACLSSGRMAEAEEAAAWAEAHGDLLQHAGMDIWRAIGVLRRRQGRRAEAFQAFERAVCLAQRTPHVLAEAQARCELADLQRETGEIAVARENLERALEIARGLGAQLVMREAKGMLAS